MFSATLFQESKMGFYPILLLVEDFWEHQHSSFCLRIVCKDFGMGMKGKHAQKVLNQEITPFFYIFNWVSENF